MVADAMRHDSHCDYLLVNRDEDEEQEQEDKEEEQKRFSYFAGAFVKNPKLKKTHFFCGGFSFD